jgi:hypothetical protein
VQRFLEQAKPDYMVMLPNWYPHLAQQHHFLQPVYEITIEHNTVCAGDRLAVYRMEW